MSTSPTGTYTFLFTDIEGSTTRWEQFPQAMHQALAQHDELLGAAIVAQQGQIVKTTGDGMLAVFGSAPQAIAAALAAQQALAAADWAAVGGIAVRMGLHTGEATARDGDYHAPALNRAARLMAAGHGGQILLSLPTYALVRDQLPAEATVLDLGEHRLKDLGRPEHIFQVSAPGLAVSFPPLATLERRRHNLPVQATQLVGRTDDLAQVLALLRRPETRLLTLTGPGGIGKTRLSLQAGAESLEDHADGVFFVPLAPVSDPRLVLATIAQVLEVREQGAESLEASLSTFLQARQLLLLLDNFEQVTEATPLLGRLLGEADGLKMLVTSRVVLHVYGEQQFPVPPLGLPPTMQPHDHDTTHIHDAAHLSQYSAVALFIQCARRIKPDFAVTNDTAPALAEICARLDGLPLAIELAAARVNLLPPAALLARLSSRLRVLTGGARNLPGRQQTLRGAIDWSYDLLLPAEQLLFARLSVFVDGWSLDAAETVCARAGEQEVDVLDGLSSLVDKSLVRQHEQREGEPRFDLLETIKEYAGEKLAAAGEHDAARKDHAAYYLALAEQAEPLLTGPEQGAWLARLEAEHGNLQAALGVHLGSAGDLAAGARLAICLTRFWTGHDHLSEGRHWLEQIMARGDHLPQWLRAGVLSGQGTLAMFQGDYAQAVIASDQALALFRELGDSLGIAKELRTLGVVAQWQSDFNRAQTFFEESLRLSQLAGDTSRIATLLSDLGTVAKAQGELERARALCEQSLALSQKTGDTRILAIALGNLGNIARRNGDLAGAQAFFQQSVDLFQALGNQHGRASCLGNLGNIAREQGDFARASALYEQCLALFVELDVKDGSAEALSALGAMALEQGDHAQAAIRLRESLALFQSLKIKEGVATSLNRLAVLAAAAEHHQLAVRLWSSADRLLEAIGTPREPKEEATHKQALGQSRATLGEEAFSAAWAEGGALTVDQAVDLALARDDAM